jgi:hypothetical protein
VEIKENKKRTAALVNTAGPDGNSNKETIK